MEKHYNLIAKNILAKIRYASVASITREGKSWNTPVAHDIDENYNIYWYSDKENQHSINIRNNSSVFIVIYDSTAPDGEGEGVYIEAIAEELTTEESIEKALRVNLDNAQDSKEFLGENIRRCYKATPQRMWVNEAEEKDGVFLRDYRVEINLI